MSVAAIAEGELLWEPSAAFRERSVIADYMRWLAEHQGRKFADYAELWRWSVTDLEGFWTSIVDFFGVEFQRRAERVLASRTMPGARWFEGGQINYTQNVFRHASADRPALLFQSETQPMTEISWADLEAKVASVADALRNMGVKPGDRVVGYMPNIPQTVIAFLAAASLGAVWSSCSPASPTLGIRLRWSSTKKGKSM